VTKLQKNGDTSTYVKTSYNLGVDQYHIVFGTKHDHCRFPDELRRIGELNLSPEALDTLIAELSYARQRKITRHEV
jgi:hypothetical protein